MYTEKDKFLKDIRRICRALPETSEVEAWGRPTFRAGKKMFAYFSGSLGDDPYALLFIPDGDEREALLHDDRFYKPKYFGPGGWLGLHLEAAPVDWEEVAELMDMSYRNVALKRMLKALDGA